MRRLSQSIIIVLIILLTTLLIHHEITRHTAPDKKPFILAFVSNLAATTDKPQSQTFETSGDAQLRGLQFYINRLNREGGVRGHPVKLLRYNDHGRVEDAKKIAEKIAKDPRILGVIGHENSTLSLAAAPIYQKNRIPAIAPTATNDHLTRDNPWYFRPIFNDAFQGQFIANYMRSALAIQQAVVLRSHHPYGSNLADNFIRNAKKIGLKITATLPLEAHRSAKEYAQKGISALVDAIKALSLSRHTALFIAGDEAESTTALIALRNAGISQYIVGPDTLATQHLPELIQAHPQRQQPITFYTRQLIVASPFILDGANQKAQNTANTFVKQFNYLPDWKALFSFDAIDLFVQALHHAEIQGVPESLTEDRQRIRKYLASLNAPHKAIPGVTGATYFNAHGDAIKPITFGLFNHGQLVSSPLQLRPNVQAFALPQLETRIASGELVPMQGTLYNQTQVVFTGIRFHSIREIDTEANSALLKFDLWFRYQGDDAVLDILFNNALEPITLKNPLREERFNDMRYRLYRIEGRFKMNFDGQQNIRFGHHLLGVHFHHRFLSKRQLLFVSDLLSLPASSGSKLVSWMNRNAPLNDKQQWHIKNATVVASETKSNILGDPSQIFTGNSATFDQSQFNALIEIAPNTFSLRRPFTESDVDLTRYFLLLILLILMTQFVALTSFASRAKPHIFQGIIFLQGILLVQALIIAESLIFQQFSKMENVPRHFFDNTVSTFDIIWFLFAALYGNRLIYALVWQPMEQKSQRPLPQVVKHFVTFLLLLFALLGIIGLVLNYPVTSLLATSGVIAMIIGLAIQMNISNIFSGIALNIERPFRIGDVVKIGSVAEGTVIDMGWRCTRIETTLKTVVNVPNHLAGEHPIENYSFPNQHIWHMFSVWVAPEQPSEKIIPLLLTAMKNAVTVPKGEMQDPGVVYNGVDARGGHYKLYFAISHYPSRLYQQYHILSSVQKELADAGISLLTQRSEHILENASPIQDVDTAGFSPNNNAG
ncbi:ABC transporter substrate-binding protein [Magnetococcales bacterium HHB-1]